MPILNMQNRAHSFTIHSILYHLSCSLLSDMKLIQRGDNANRIDCAVFTYSPTKHCIEHLKKSIKC